MGRKELNQTKQTLYIWPFIYLKTSCMRAALPAKSLGHYRSTSETPFKWRFAVGPTVARFNVHTEKGGSVETMLMHRLILRFRCSHTCDRQQIPKNE